MRAGVVRSSVPVALGTALSRLTGLARLAALAYALGFTRLTDTYNLANTTPNIVYELLLGGLLSATLVPVFVDHLARDDDQATSAVVTVAGVALVALTVAGVMAAPAIVRLYTLSVDGPAAADQQAVATTLLRMLMPQMLFYGMTAMVTALLHARRRFAAPAFTPVLNNLVVTAVFLALPRLASGPLVLSEVRDDTRFLVLLGAGTTAGIAAMALALVVSVRRAGIRLRPNFDWTHPAVRRVVALSGWTAGYVASNQVALWVVLVLANGVAGGVSAYQAAFVFFQLPHGLLAVSLMTTLSPELATTAGGGDLAGFRSHLRDGVRLMAVAILPAAAGYVVLAGPIVVLLLSRGALSPTSIDLTAGCLRAFAVGLPAFSLYLLTLRAFYALGDTKTPFVLNAFENVLNVALAFALFPRFGVAGLAFAYAGAYTVASVAALGVLSRRIGGRVVDAALGVDLARAAAAAAAMTAVVWVATDRLLDVAPLPVVAAGGVVAGVVVYAGALTGLGVEGIRTLPARLRHRP